MEIYQPEKKRPPLPVRKVGVGRFPVAGVSGKPRTRERHLRSGATYGGTPRAHAPMPTLPPVTRPADLTGSRVRLTQVGL